MVVTLKNLKYKIKKCKHFFGYYMIPYVFHVLVLGKVHDAVDLTIWVCFASTGPDALVKVNDIMNSTKYQDILDRLLAMCTGYNRCKTVQ
jgi:VanZ family protein